MLMNSIKFNSKSKNGKCLSNFSAHPVEINNIIYLTGEHAFHGQKYRWISTHSLGERKESLVSYAEKFEGIDSEFSTPQDAKKAGGKKGMKLQPLEMYTWDSSGSSAVQRLICKYKLNNYDDIKQTLYEFDHCVFIHQDNRATERTPWGGKINKDGVLVGQNKLGKIWREMWENYKSL